MEDKEELQQIIRFPAKMTAPDVYQCPCGSSGLHHYRVYKTGLDDADPEWGAGDDVYGFDYRDPCFKKYKVLYLDEQTHEFVLSRRMEETVSDQIGII